MQISIILSEKNDAEHLLLCLAEGTVALSCKRQSFASKYKIMQAYFIFCLKILHISKICCNFARFFNL